MTKKAQWRLLLAGRYDPMRDFSSLATHIVAVVAIN